MCDVSKHRRAFRLGRQRSEATPPPFRTLNGKLLLIRPLRGRNVRQTSAVLNGILQGAPLTPLHNAPQSERPAPATGNKSPMSNSRLTGLLSSLFLFILIRRKKHAGKTKDNKVCNKEYHHHIAYTSQRIRKPIRNLVLMGNTHILLNLPIYTYKPDGKTPDTVYSSYPKFQFVFILCHTESKRSFLNYIQPSSNTSPPVHSRPIAIVKYLSAPSSLKNELKQS